MRVGVSVMMAQNIDVIRKLSWYGVRPIFSVAFLLTARQYGEVMLPDAASGNNPGTRRQASHITVPVQGGYGAVFAIMVQCFSEPGAVAVQSLVSVENISRYCYFVNNHWRSVAAQ